VFEAHEYQPREAALLLAWFRQLYDIEDRARAQSAVEVLPLRREASAPVMHRMPAWLDSEAARSVLPNSPLGQAIGYLNNQSDALAGFLGNGDVPIDNNETEQLMKPVAAGRRNWLFIGSAEAGYRAAILMTIVSTAHRYPLAILSYVKDVLDRLLGGERDLAALRAERWALEHPQALRPHRVEEACYGAEAKTVRYARRWLADQRRSQRP
jgi:hypothetical protein